MWLRLHAMPPCIFHLSIGAMAAGKFFWFLLFNLLTLIYFTFFGKSICMLLCKVGPVASCMLKRMLSCHWSMLCAACILLFACCI